MHIVTAIRYRLREAGDNETEDECENLIPAQSIRQPHWEIAASINTLGFYLALHEPLLLLTYTCLNT